MTLEALLALAAAVFVFSLKPGPGIMTSISYSLTHGVSGLVAFLVGFNLGLGVFLTVVFLGLMGINHFHLDLVFLGILAKSIAALYLLTIGAKELQTWNQEVDLKMVKIETAKRSLDIASSAFILTISNPMVIVFYAAIIPVFVAPEIMTFQVAVIVIAMLMLIDSFGMIIYCTPILIFRKSVPPAFMKYVRLLSAIIILIIGLYIGYSALPSKDLTSVF